MANGFLFYAENGRLKPYEAATPERVAQEAESAKAAITALLSQKDYPCVAALRSFHQNEYNLGVYGDLGRCDEVQALYRDLKIYIREQRHMDSQYLSFWAIFPEFRAESEENFETALWSELSSLSALEPPETPWDPHYSSDPSKDNFCFSLAGEAVFAVGMHPLASRLSRRFPYPAIVFNLYAQFRQLAEAGQYDPMVELNRKRDISFQGNVNPMSEKYGETREAIQFSGKNNPDSWKCPFHRKN